MRRILFMVAIVFSLCFLQAPLVKAAPEDEEKSGSEIDDIIKELEGLKKDVDRVLKRVRRLQGKPEATEFERLTQAKSREILQRRRRAIQLLQNRELEESIKEYRSLLKEMEKYGLPYQDVAVSRYNLSCAYALNGDTDKAFKALISALEYGYVEFDHIGQDPDLNSLHDDERWKEIFDKKDEYTAKARKLPTGMRGQAGRGMTGRRGGRGMGNQRRYAELQRLAQRAMQLLQDRKLDESIEAYLELIEKSKEARLSGTGIAVHYYNLACAYSLNKNKDDAFKALIQSLENGYVDFVHMDGDTDLNNLHDDPRWKEMFAKKDEYIAKAQDKVLEGFTRRFDAEDYLKDFDKGHNIIYMTNLGKGTLEAMKSQLNERADIQWKNLFTHRFRRPLAILALARDDFRKIVPNPGVGGFYNPANHVLVVPELSYTLIHEFTHALHNADAQARRQSHPLWIMEGLATLFESSIVEEGKIKCLLNPRLEVLRRAIQRNQAPSWDRFMEAGRGNFMRNAGLNYAYTRYVFYWLWEQGILKDWYEAYAAGYKHDKTGKRAFEYVLNMKLADAEKKWRDWVLACPTAPRDMSVGRAFFGVSTAETPDGLRVEQVIEGTGAEKAGLKVGDIILEFEGEKIESRETFMKSIQARRVGDTVKIKVKRDEEIVDLSILLTGRPATAVTSRRQPGGTTTPGGTTRPGGPTRVNPRSLAPTIGVRTEETEDGLAVRRLYRGATAEAAGIKAGDIITEFNGEEITSSADFDDLLKECKLGDKVDITVKRDDEEVELEVEIGARMALGSSREGRAGRAGRTGRAGRMGRGDFASRPFMGVGTEESEDGLLVLRVIPDSGADKAGIKVDDVIIAFDGEKISDRMTFVSKIGEHKIGDKLKLTIKRDGEEMEIEVELGGRTGMQRPGGMQPRRRRGIQPREPDPDDKSGFRTGAKKK